MKVIRTIIAAIKHPTLTGWGKIDFQRVMREILRLPNRFSLFFAVMAAAGWYLQILARETVLITLLLLAVLVLAHVVLVRGRWRAALSSIRVSDGGVKAEIKRDRRVNPDLTEAYETLFADVRDRAAIFSALQQSETKYRQIIESIPLGMHIYRLEPDGQLIFDGANPAADRILNINNSQFIGLPIEAAFPPLADTEIPDQYRRVAAQGRAWRKNQIHYSHGDIAGAFEVHAFQTAPDRMVAAFQDITARMEYEQALRSHLEFERLLISNAVRFINVNTQSLTDELERALAEVGRFTKVDFSFVFLFSDDYREMVNLAVWAHHENAFDTQAFHTIPAHYLPGLVDTLQEKDVFQIASRSDIPADEIWLSEYMQKIGVHSVIGVPVIQRQVLIGFLGLASHREHRTWPGESVALLQLLAEIVANALERKSIEGALLDSEARYRAIVEDQTELIVRWNPDGVRTFVNDSYCRYFQKTRQELLGTSFLDQVAEQDRQLVGDQINDLSPEHHFVSYEERSVTPDGELRWLAWTDRGIFDADGRLQEVQSVGRDIHDQKLIEDALGTIARGVSADVGEAFFRSLVDHLAQALGADLAFVGELVSPQRVRTLAVCAQGEPRPNFEYALPGSPCETVIGKQICVYPQDVHALFASDYMLAEMGIQGYAGAPLFDSAEHSLGILVVLYQKPITNQELAIAMLKIFAARAAAELERSRAEERLRLSNRELEIAYDTTLEGWAMALELRDKETEGHSRRVTALTLKLAEALGLSEQQRVHIRRGALLHDIGKMGIPDEILQKRGALNEAEWMVMRQHPVYAHNLLSTIPYLAPALDIPYSHHERWDGSGYPHGLGGEQIPLAARIFTVVDVWDALLSDRPYRAALPRNEVIAYLHQNAGRIFDPHVVEVFLQQVIQV